MDGDLRRLQRAFDASGEDKFIVEGALLKALHRHLHQDIGRQNAGIAYFERDPQRLGRGRTAERRMEGRVVRLEATRYLLEELEAVHPALLVGMHPVEEVKRPTVEF
jgi:hypothetical protein